MNAAERLRLEKNPFAASASSAGIGLPLRKALRDVTLEIALETPIVVLAGREGTGKTLLLSMAARVWTDMGLTVRQVDHGDRVRMAPAQRPDLLLIDEADSIADTMLHALVSVGGKNAATTVVFVCLPWNVGRFRSLADPVAVVELTPLTQSEARNYLLEQVPPAGRPDLFTPEALELVVKGSGGSPRLLQSIASLAFFSAAFDGASQISSKHVLLFLERRRPTKRSVQCRPVMIQFPRVVGGKSAMKGGSIYF
jgi:type II secretory pathway predicted ATPase ExeA